MGDRANRGKYRNVPVRIMGALPMQPYMIQPALEQLLQHYEEWKTKKHPLKAIALFHLEFESIHPFIDGNGRTGRLLLNLELSKAGYFPIDIKFTDRRAYYESFDEYHRMNQNAEPMVQMLASYETSELQQYISIIK